MHEETVGNRICKLGELTLPTRRQCVECFQFASLIRYRQRFDFGHLNIVQQRGNLPAQIACQQRRIG